MRGRFIGIGVGPGDPELLTLKAARVIRECHVAAVPVSDPGLEGPVYEEASGESAYAAYLEKCAAYQIALAAVPELAEKAKLFLPMPMIKEKAVLKAIHDRDAGAAEAVLDEGKDIAILRSSLKSRAGRLLATEGCPVVDSFSSFASGEKCIVYKVKNGRFSFLGEQYDFLLC